MVFVGIPRKRCQACERVVATVGVENDSYNERFAHNDLTSEAALLTGGQRCCRTWYRKRLSQAS